MERSDLTKEQRWEIADRLVLDRIDIVNQLQEPAAPRTNTFYIKYGKRIMDIFISGIAIVVTLPINLIIGIITFFDVGRPIFFKQERIGKNGKIFTLVKFRNMKNTVDVRGELLPASQRVTKFGKFVRKTSLDELLNFWAVFKGDMSIIGPRPLVPEYKKRFSTRHEARFIVKPGLECPPRIWDAKARTWQEQFENDIWYVENISFKTDLLMMVNLVRFTVDKKSTTERAVFSRGKFMGYDLCGNAINLEAVPQEYIDVYDRTRSI